jgi:hypothetical protein
MRPSVVVTPRPVERLHQRNLNVRVGSIAPFRPTAANGSFPSLPDLHGNSSRVCNAAIAVIEPTPINWRYSANSGHSAWRLIAAVDQCLSSKSGRSHADVALGAISMLTILPATNRRIEVRIANVHRDGH